MADCLEKCLRAIELLGPNDYSSARLRARLWAGNALVALGRPVEARIHHDDLRAAAGRLRDRIWISRSTEANTVAALAIGDWQGVREGTEAVLVSRNIEQLTFAPLMAEAIRRISEDSSVSSLFD